MAERVLITGGTGLIGTRVCSFLSGKGFRINILTRSPGLSAFQQFQWDPTKNKIDLKAFKDVSYIIHLAGANIGKDKWSKKHKALIINSRVESTKLLNQGIKDSKANIKAIIGASGVGYYPQDDFSSVFTETSKNGSDFLADVTRKWEEEQKKLRDHNCRLVLLRTGVVLSEKGGVLKKMEKPVKMFVGAPLGTGKQILSWIHIEDLVNLYLYAINNEKIDGIYNAVAPFPLTNALFMKTLARTLGKPFFMPRVPKFMLRLMLGEQADLVVNGSNASCRKLQQSGFEFKYPKLTSALKQIYSQ